LEPAGRAALLLAGVGTTSVLAVLAAAVLWPVVVGPLAYPALAAIGSMTGAALMVVRTVTRTRR
jgi:hypothetical protein